MDTSQIISVAIFVVAMIAIMTEKVHRALVAITGAMLLLILHIMPFETAIGHIDFNTLGVLFGMMLFVAVVKQSGVFEFLAIKCARVAKGNPWTIMVLFVLLTAVLSAFLDNVTTVLLIGPMTITVCRLLDIDPVPFFMTQILASNIGGTATLIGDPPNIMIGSAAGYSFVDFVLYDTPAALLSLAVMLALFYLLFGRKLHVDDAHKDALAGLDEREQIKNPVLLRQSVVMIVLVVAGFMAHGSLGIESCVVALTAAGVLMLISGERIEEALAHVEWTTLVFFAGLFIIVGALSEVGVIGMLAQALIDVTGGSTFVAMLVLLFASAIVSSFLDNIPFVATMIPILLSMEATGMDVAPLWWAVSLGACLGGNGTLIGASANVVMSDISRKNGHVITFAHFFKVGFPTMLATVAVSAIYLIVRFPPM
ncbi:SLC13 family permease [Senegalimassilia anaerobia]|uniref:SLC13 family permease n=1 Tax=Senegalimassilia anaerobia TaxID=1473216 RepID=UPI003A96ED0E